jgi:hypothetical protein
MRAMRIISALALATCMEICVVGRPWSREVGIVHLVVLALLLNAFAKHKSDRETASWQIQAAFRGISNGVCKFNDFVAVNATKVFGCMWTAYGFLIFGLLPALPALHRYQDNFLYWSNCCQLLSLPLIMVGGNVLGRAAEQRSKADHQMLLDAVESLTKLHEGRAEGMAVLTDLVQEMHNRLDQYEGKEPQAPAAPIADTPKLMIVPPRTLPYETLFPGIYEKMLSTAPVVDQASRFDDEDMGDWLK